MSAPDFIFQATGHIAGWLAASGAFELADDAFRVEGAEPQKTLPAALVYPLGEEAGANVGGRAATVQAVTARIGVLHILAAPNRPSGRGKGHDRTKAAVAASREAILRKRTGEGADGPIPGARGLLVFAGGALEEIANGRIYWLDRYTVEWGLDSQTFNGA